MKISKKIKARNIKFGVISGAYIVPAMFIYILLVISPGFLSLFYAFTNWNGVGHTFDFVGFNNFVKLFKDNYFLTAIKNNFIFLFFVGFMQNTISLIIAVILNEKLKGYRVFRNILYLPFVLTPVGVGIAFIYIFHPKYGVIRMLLDMVGLQNVSANFLGNPQLAVITVCIVAIWVSIGFRTMVWLSGLQNLNKDVIEAAMIDGVNNFQMLLKIIVPLLIPALTVITILTIVGNFKVYDLPISITAGQPGYASAVAPMFILEQAFQNYHFGYAMAGSAVTFLIPLILIIVAYMLLKRKFV